MNSRVTEIFKDDILKERIKNKLSNLFSIAELESSRAGKIGMEVGSTRENFMEYIEKSSIVFGITEKDIQQLAFESIGRKLNQKEKNKLRNTILLNFTEWDNWIKEMISREASEVV